MNYRLVGAAWIIFTFASHSLAQNLPQGTALPGDTLIPLGKSSGRGNAHNTLPGDQTIPSTQAYEIGDHELRAAIAKSRQALDEARQKVMEKDQTTSLPVAESAAVDGSTIANEDFAPPAIEPPPSPEPPAKPRSPASANNVAAKTLPAYSDHSDGVRVFNRAVQSAVGVGKDTYTLPSTSVALATTLYGIEATGSIDRTVPAELNYAWLGPNGSVVEMKNCRLWILVRGDYSTERVYGTSQSMTCRTPSGETFDIPIEAHMIDQSEEYLGARGTLVARGKALASAMSFLSDGVKAFGTAMAAAQVATEVSSGGFGESVKGSNVGGDKTQYIVGQSLAGSSAKFLDWWIGYYQSLSPTIAIGPGKKIYLAIQRTVQVPKIFFGSPVTATSLAALTAEADSDHKTDASLRVNTTKAINSYQLGSMEEDVKP